MHCYFLLEKCESLAMQKVFTFSYKNSRDFVIFTFEILTKNVTVNSLTTGPRTLMVQLDTFDIGVLYSDKRALANAEPGGRGLLQNYKRGARAEPLRPPPPLFI